MSPLIGSDCDDKFGTVHQGLEVEPERTPVTGENVENVVCDILSAAKNAWGWKTVTLFPNDVVREIFVECLQICPLVCRVQSPNNIDTPGVRHVVVFQRPLEKGVGLEMYPTFAMAIYAVMMA
jgi:hypothetical protein